MAPETKLVEFRKSHPIDFSLLDHDDQAVMYISEDKGDWALHLTIANTSSQPITLADGQGAASGANHHFALRFRSGTLSKRTLGLLTTEEFKNIVKTPWALAKLEQPAPDAVVTLYLLCTGKNTLAPNEKLPPVELSGISAAPGSGSRGTQVELIPNHKQVKFADQTEVAGSRTQYLHVTNHSGRKNIPLHVAIVEGNRVLNGETVGKLTLRITNVFQSKNLSKPSTIMLRGSGETKTKLVLSYDASEDDWALAKTDAASKVKVTPPANATVEPFKQGETPECVITFNQDFQLESRKHLDITIEKLAVSPKPGNANLYLRYENIPGYWDGQFVCTVEKGPIVVKDGNVGIGTPEPKNALDIKGGLVIGSYAGLKNAPDNGLQVERDVIFDHDLTVENGTVKSRWMEATSQIKGATLMIGGDLLRVGTVEITMSKPLTVKSEQAGATALTVTQTKSDKLESALVVGSFDTQSDQHIAVKVAGGSKYSAGIKLRAATDNIGFTINYDDKNPALRISRHWIDETKTALEIDVTNGSTSISGDLVVKKDLYVEGSIVWHPPGGTHYFLHVENHSGWHAMFDGIRRKPFEAQSDLRLKREVQTLPSALDKVRHLRGVTFSWNEDALEHFTRDIETTVSAGPNATEPENQKVWQTVRDKRRNQLSTTQVGVLAQDVESILPEAVTTDAEGYKLVRYDNLIPLLIEAIKEQDQLAARQQTEIEQLKQALLVAAAPRQH
jgi:Chaperone of endosialidase